MATNPFTYTGAQAPEVLIDREAELARLMELASAGQHARLQGQRGLGKTTLIGALAARLNGQGWRIAYADLYGTLTAADLADRLAEAYEQGHSFGAYKLPAPFGGPIRQRVQQLRRRLGGGGAGPVSFTLTDVEATTVLRDVLDQPRNHVERTGERVLCVLDEFQAILTAPGELDAVLRSRIQHQAGVAYLFAGSHPTLLRELFEERERAFYGQTTPVTLDRLPVDALGGYVAEQFEATEREITGGALESLLALSAGHPQRAMLLAHHMWRRSAMQEVGERTVGAALTDALGELRDTHAEVLGQLRAGHERFLALIADKRSPYAEESLRAVDLSKSAAQSAERALLASGRLERGADRLLRLADPLLGARLRERHLRVALAGTDELIAVGPSAP